MKIGLFPIHKVDSNNYSKDAKIVRDFNSNVDILIQMEVRFHGNMKWFQLRMFK